MVWDNEPLVFSRICSVSRFPPLISLELRLVLQHHPWLWMSDRPHYCSSVLVIEVPCSTLRNQQLIADK